MILTQITDDRALPAAHRASAEAVLGDVRVIAIDQQLMQGATGASPEQGTTHTVTLEVTAAQAERVTLAERLGHLSLIVRAADAAPDTQGDTPPTTWGGDVSPAPSRNSKPSDLKWAGATAEMSPIVGKGAD